MRPSGWTVLAIAMTVVATGCAKHDRQSAMDRKAAAQFTPPATRTPTPLPGQANATPLTAYVGHYPHDAVGGVDFFDRSEVASALNDAVGDPKLRSLVTARDGPETPIFRTGTRIAAWGCVAHDCGDRNWTLFVPLSGGKPSLCYHDADRMRSGSAWYEGGAPTRRAGGCPSAATS